MTVSQIKDHQSESVKKLIDWLKENKITEVECIFPDIAGSSKGKIFFSVKKTSFSTRFSNSVEYIILIFIFHSN